jgi:hypothetical protein
MEDFRFPNPHVARWRDALATQPREAERALRRHAWQLLYRLSRPGPPDGCPELGWECWITAEQLFSPQPPPRLRMLQVPRQAEVNTGPRLLLSAIYYNEPAEATITTVL